MKKKYIAPEVLLISVECGNLILASTEGEDNVGTRDDEGNFVSDKTDPTITGGGPQDNVVVSKGSNFWDDWD